jgi:hypothetical protein
MKPATQILNTILLRHQSMSVRTADSAETVLTAAAAMYAAYEQVLRQGPWPSLASPPVQKTLTAGKITHADLGYPSIIRAFTSDPTADDAATQARRVRSRGSDNTYRYYPQELGSLWFITWAAAPQFIADVVPTDGSGGATGIRNAVFYRHGSTTADRKLYQQIDPATTTAYADFANAAKWDPNPMIWAEAEPIIMLLALADLLGNTEQERLQQKTVRADAEDKLTQLYNFHGLGLETHV